RWRSPSEARSSEAGVGPHRSADASNSKVAVSCVQLRHGDILTVRGWAGRGGSGRSRRSCPPGRSGSLAALAGNGSRDVGVGGASYSRRKRELAARDHHARTTDFDRRAIAPPPHFDPRRSVERVALADGEHPGGVVAGELDEVAEDGGCGGAGGGVFGDAVGGSEDAERGAAVFEDTNIDRVDGDGGEVVEVGAEFGELRCRAEVHDGMTHAVVVDEDGRGGVIDVQAFEERFGVVERQGSWGGAREPSA